MTRYSRLVLGATLIIVVAMLAWGLSLPGHDGTSARTSGVALRAYQPAIPASVWSDEPPTPTPPVLPVGTTSVTTAPSATRTPVIAPTATATPVPAVNNGKPCLQLEQVACGASGSQTVDPRSSKTVRVTGRNWQPGSRVSVYLVKVADACALKPGMKQATALVDASGAIRADVPLPASARNGDTYRLCAQQGIGKGAVVPTGANLLIGVSEPSASPFDVYSAAALLLVVISALVGAPELARMLSRMGGQPGA